jgi:hypothetical protein
MEKEITTKTLFRAIEEVVAEVGDDFVYQSPEAGECKYLHNRQPSCLFGRGLTKLGIDQEVLEEGDRGGWGLSDLEDIGHFSMRAIYAFNDAQRMQDSGHSYGDVLNDLKARLTRIGAI